LRHSVAPDYILCEKDRVDDLIAACTETSVSFNNLSILTDGIALSLDTFFPPHPSPNSYRTAPASSALLLDRYMDRQMKMLEKADSEGKVVYNGGLDKESRRMGITIVKLNENGTGEKGGLVEEEIFGPILPIIPVQVSCVGGARAEA
jgi:aldehyde dehydrogenase (NAD+)